MAFRLSFEPEKNDQVLFQMDQGLMKITLNRPRHLNCLTHQMVSAMKKSLQECELDPTVKLVVIKGSGKAFCGGGDVAKIMQVTLAGHWSYSALFYRKQLMMDYLVAMYSKPTVFLVNGIVMGGGAGFCLNGRFRIVTQNTVFAMPEVSIGLFPDVGVSYFLSRLPGHLGEYLGLAGAQIDGAEMVSIGLATHFVLSEDIELLECDLCKVASRGTKAIAEVIAKFACFPKWKTTSPCTRLRLETINRCFSRKTMEELLESLEDEVKNNLDHKWIANAIEFIKSASPTSLKITLRAIREARSTSLKECLARDYLIATHFGRRTVNNDFFKGAKAKFFEKDGIPKWQPSKLEEVSDEMISKFYSPIDDEDWVDLKLQDHHEPHGSKSMGNSKL